MQKNKILLYIISLFLLVAFAAYFSGLFIDVTRDAGKYATAAKEIYQNGNFINLTVHGEPYDQKPPLLFWLGAIGFSIGGVSNFWFKFPIFLLILAGFYWAFRLGESLYNRKIGIVTAILLFFSLIYSLYSMDIHTDTPLQAFVTLALWQLFEFLKSGKNKNFILGFTGIGLAMLSKGPIGAAIPAFAVVGHIVLKKDFRQFLDYRWYLGIVLSLLIVSPALIGLMNQFGWNGIKFFFWENMAGRITGSYVQAINDPIFYFHNLLYQLLPWSVLFYISVFFEFKTLIKRKLVAGEYFTLTGIWIYFIILNLATSQLPNYVFAIVPLMAVLASKWIIISTEQLGKKYRIFFTTQNVIVASIWVLIFIIALYLFPFPKIYYWIIVFAGVTSTIYIYKTNLAPVIKLVAPSAIAFACFIFLMNTYAFPYIFSFQAPPKAARYFTENAKEGEKLYNYKYGQYELFFYSEPQAALLHNFDEVKLVAGKKGNWIFTDDEGYQEIKKLGLNSEKILEFQHLYLNRGGKFIPPKTRENVLYPMYLIKY